MLEPWQKPYRSTRQGRTPFPGAGMRAKESLSMSQPIVPVILCGGSGTRLWPLSRASYPKQFNRMLGEKSLFQASVERLPVPISRRRSW